MTGRRTALREAVSEHGATLSCLCSTDAIYLDRATAVLDVLQNTDVQRRYVAGHPRTLAAAFGTAGADQFIYTGCDVLESLGEALSVAGVG